ncbi:hypothetical protein EUTSA_v10000601mg [Eutrema salsugineum]|uniref:F-box domain-containing protein n=1 Tax=Eutrema salsugineum TaxID=72664 RepID=V4LV28_EUTSA|nr:hypothetical protein EUTSA_v10000601mg [Eutrema salsugineum]
MISSKQRSSLLLPFELVEEILYRLPFETLGRFKSICKHWYALINDKRFIYKYLDLSKERSIQNDHETSQLFDPETKAVSNELHSLLYSKMIHCHGLLLCKCLETLRCSYTMKLAVWNPILRQFKWIKPSNSRKFFDVYGFGYDNVSQIEIYEFKSKLWRSVDTILDCDALRKSVSMNGNMYWIAQKGRVNSEIEIFIQSFDFSTEMFKPICCVPIPKGIVSSVPFDHKLLLSGLGGHRLSLFHQHNDVEVKVWVTSKVTDGINVSWSKYFNVTIDPSILHSISTFSIPEYFTLKNNKIMLLCEETDIKKKCMYTSIYEMGEGEIKKQVTMRGQKIWCNVYVPSLVPVPE